MGRGKFKNKPTGERQFSSREEMIAGTSSRPDTFTKKEFDGYSNRANVDSDSEDDVSNRKERRNGLAGLIEIENPNYVKPKTVKLKDIVFDIPASAEMSRREKEEAEQQASKERVMKLREQGKTEQARKDLERLSLIREKRAEAAKKKEEEKVAQEAAEKRRVAERVAKEEALKKKKPGKT